MFLIHVSFVGFDTDSKLNWFTHDPSKVVTYFVKDKPYSAFILNGTKHDFDSYFLFQTAKSQNGAKETNWSGQYSLWPCQGL